MPLLYGEGEKAFMRLQEEIIKSSEGQTIFAWGGSEDAWFDEIAHVENSAETPIAPNDLGVLALSPDAFIGCEDNIPLLDFDYTRSTFMFTNRCLQISLSLIGLLSSGYCIGVLDCRRGGNESVKVGTILRWTDSGVLARATGLVEIPDTATDSAQPVQVSITKDPGRVFRFGYTERTVVVREDCLFSAGYRIARIQGEEPHWDPNKNALRIAVKAGQGLDRVAILAFHQGHTRTGFLVGILLDLISDECVAENFAPPECQDVDWHELKRIAEKFWKLATGNKFYPKSASPVAHMAADKYKWDGQIPNQQQWNQVLFLEKWSTTHLRLVSVKALWESCIILDISSTLWEIPPQIDKLRSSLTNGQVWDLVHQAQAQCREV